ncbi:hypothetical protein ACI5KX_02880 [Erythrobacter sp. GH1-10]
MIFTTKVAKAIQSIAIAIAVEVSIGITSFAAAVFGQSHAAPTF